MGYQAPIVRHNILADFVAEWTEAELPKEYGAYSNWIMHFDGSKMLAGLRLPPGTRSSTSYKYYTQTPTMQPNMRLYCMVFGWQSLWASNA